MNEQQLKCIIEGAIFAAPQPLKIDQLLQLFTEEDQVDKDRIRAALVALAEDCAARGIELFEVASGYRFQVKSELAPWISRLWQERAPKYSRATLETLALIAYRQPITRGEIEDVRGVAVSSNIIKSLLEREWIRVVGHREVPGRPALFATTKQFLDDMNLSSLAELPVLAELKDLDELSAQVSGQLKLDVTESQGIAQDAEQAETTNNEEQDESETETETEAEITAEIEEDTEAEHDTSAVTDNESEPLDEAENKVAISDET